LVQIGPEPFSPMHRLRSLKVSSTIEDLEILALPLKQITEVEFHAYSINSLVALLAEYPNITSASMKNSLIPGLFSRGAELSMVTTQICTLTIKMQDSWDIEPSSYLLDHLTVPSLSTLVLSNDEEKSVTRNQPQTEGIADPIFSSLSACLRRSSNLEESEHRHHKLTTLRIHHINIEEDGILPSLFSLIPSLETLDLDDRLSIAPFISTMWLRRLLVNHKSGTSNNSELDTQPIESAPILPRLQQLSLKTQATTESHIHCPTLVDVVRSRWLPEPTSTGVSEGNDTPLRTDIVSLSSVKFISEAMKVEKTEMQPLIDLALEARGKLRVTFIDQSGIII
jgi:hypothetical protein